MKSSCYHEHKDGFYVYARPNKCDPKTVVKYIGRYLGHPVIATSRIVKYDGDFVTFHYNRHEDDVYVEETLPVMEFIERLIQHIPEKHYKMIRYGGIYARHRDIDKKLRRAISREKYLIYKCTRKSCPVLVEEGRPHDFPNHLPCVILLSKEAAYIKPDTEKLRKKYMDNPPEGMTSESPILFIHFRIVYFWSVSVPFRYAIYSFPHTSRTDKTFLNFSPISLN